MPNISSKQRLVEAAEAVLVLPSIRRIQAVIGDEEKAALDELRKALEAARPKPTADLPPFGDPDYYRALAARGGKGGRGAQKRRSDEHYERLMAGGAQRLGGLATKGVKKHRVTKRGTRCRCGKYVDFHDPQVGRVFGQIKGREASWYQCPGCKDPVDPFVWEDEREV